MSVDIELQRLRNGPVADRDELEASWLADVVDGLMRAGDAPLQVEWRASRVVDLVEVSATVRGEVSFDCGRCTAPRQLRVEASFVHHFVPHGQLDAGDRGEETDGEDVSEHDGLRIDLAPLCQEHFVLALPTAPTCVDDEPTDEAACDERTAALLAAWNKPVEEATSPWAALRDVEVKQA